MNSTVLKTAGYISIAVGCYLIHKANQLEGVDIEDILNDYDIIDVDFEVIED